MTSATAACAHSRGASVLPPSATITRSTRSRGSAPTTAPIDASSLRVGMTTTVLPPAAMRSQAPAQAAARARGWLSIGEKTGAEGLIGGPVPDLAQALLRG